MLVWKENEKCRLTQCIHEHVTLAMTRKYQLHGYSLGLLAHTVQRLGVYRVRHMFWPTFKRLEKWAKTYAAPCSVVSKIIISCSASPSSVPHWQCVCRTVGIEVMKIQPKLLIESDFKKIRAQKWFNQGSAKGQRFCSYGWKSGPRSTLFM